MLHRATMTVNVEIFNGALQHEGYSGRGRGDNDRDRDQDRDQDQDQDQDPLLDHSSSHSESDPVGEVISQPGEHDVLLGRGGGTNNHSGNILFRKLVNEHKMRYLACSKVDKPKVARDVVLLWRKMTPPGRFLSRKDDSKRGPGSVKATDNEWYEVGDKKAREKASQCLRERTPDVLPYIKHLREQQDAMTEQGVSLVQKHLQMQQQAEHRQQQHQQQQEPLPLQHHQLQEDQQHHQHQQHQQQLLDFEAPCPMTARQGFSTRRSSMPVASDMALTGRRASMPVAPELGLSGRRASMPLVPEAGLTLQTGRRVAPEQGLPGHPHQHFQLLHQQQQQHSHPPLQPQQQQQQQQHLYHNHAGYVAGPEGCQTMSLGHVTNTMGMHTNPSYSTAGRTGCNSMFPSGSVVASLHQPLAPNELYTDDFYCAQNPATINDSEQRDMIALQQQLQMQEMQLRCLQQQHQLHQHQQLHQQQQLQQCIRQEQQQQRTHLGAVTASSLFQKTCDPYEVQSDPLFDIPLQDSHFRRSSPPPALRQPARNETAAAPVRSALKKAAKAQRPTSDVPISRRAPDRAPTSASLMSINTSPDCGEITIEEYRKQLEEYIENNQLNDGYDIDDDDIDDIECPSDLEDDWEKEREKNLQREKHQRTKRGVNRNVSGSSLMSAKTIKSNLSMVSGISGIFSDTSSQVGRDRRPSQSRSVCSSVSLMSELTDLSENIDNLDLDE